MTIRVEPAYDHFAKQWGVVREVAKRRVLSTLYDAPDDLVTPQQRTDVLQYLHGLNGRPIVPSKAVAKSDALPKIRVRNMDAKGTRRPGDSLFPPEGRWDDDD